MNGFIVINKEKGFTSSDVVVILKKILKIKKIGHSGTLDPEATGVLVIGVGQNTKLLEYVVSENKIYEGEIIFGFCSDTDDIFGNIKLANFDYNNLTLNRIDKAFDYFSGKNLFQTPPMYSSIKIKGKKLYEYARSGKVIKLKKRKINILELKRKSNLYKKNKNYCINFKANVSKGTYIRSLCVDFGKFIKVPAVMGNLKRTSIGTFNISDSYKIEDINKELKNKNYNFLRPAKNFIEKKMDVFNIDSINLKKIFQGQMLENSLHLKEKTLFAYEWKKDIVSICNIENNMIKVIKNLNEVVDEIL